MLTCPFPYRGGKRRWAMDIWNRLGSPSVYVEPFAGSLAVLLAKPDGPAKREIVCDLDGGICNFWRAVRYAPDEVVYYADWPTIHQDLTARHTYLKRWIVENSKRLSEDMDYFDARVAGLWVWGISLWIGGGWCAIDESNVQLEQDTIPFVSNDVGGQGFSAQVRTGHDGMPFVNHHYGGQGVSAQRRKIKASGRDECYEDVFAINRRKWLLDWFRQLQERLQSVVVLNRSWQSALTPTLLQHTPSSPKPSVAVLLDPPYRNDLGRSKQLYSNEEQSTDVAVDSYEWAVDNGERFRIAYCCHDGDFPIPDGWVAQTRSFRSGRDGTVDQIMYSPICEGQQKLL